MIYVLPTSFLLFVNGQARNLPLQASTKGFPKLSTCYIIITLLKISQQIYKYSLQKEPTHVVCRSSKTITFRLLSSIFKWGLSRSCLFSFPLFFFTKTPTNLCALVILNTKIQGQVAAPPCPHCPSLVWVARATLPGCRWVGPRPARIIPQPNLVSLLLNL